jgi:hypothetical protein
MMIAEAGMVRGNDLILQKYFTGWVAPDDDLRINESRDLRLAAWTLDQESQGRHAPGGDERGVGL